MFGKDAWHDDAAIHPRIAYIPGDVYLWPNLSGGEIIDLLLRLNGRTHNQKTDELMQRFEFDPKKKPVPTQKVTAKKLRSSPPCHKTRIFIFSMSQRQGWIR